MTQSPKEDKLEHARKVDASFYPFVDALLAYAAAECGNDAKGLSVKGRFNLNAAKRFEAGDQVFVEVTLSRRKRRR